jgi:hypothetical protein
MPEKPRRSTSVYDINPNRKKQNLLEKPIPLSGAQLTVGIIIGILLTIVTIVLQCIAFFTPHWKEISPNTNSLYVDGIDALIRIETLVYFNSIHRFTHQSYGLFQRCEYLLNNSSKFIHQNEEMFNHQPKTCSKNLVPSYEDNQFNLCHSLQYHRFCSQTSKKKFDLVKDYLRTTFDISSNPNRNLDLTASCDCRYPKYVTACHVLGIFALIFLFLTALLFSLFPRLKSRHQRLKVKCFAVLASLFSMIFILINLSVVLNYLHYESIEYLTSIERHYRLNQIYKLSQDTKLAIDRFVSSIIIKTGYSTKIAWIAFALSIIDGILLMITCKVKDHEDDDAPLRFTGISMESSQESDQIRNEEYQTLTALVKPIQNTTDSQFPPPPPPPIVTTERDEQSKPHSYSPPSCLKRSPASRIHFDDEV